MAAHLKLVPQVDEQSEVFSSLIEKQYKISVLCRSINFKFVSNFTGSIDKGKVFSIAYPANTDIFNFKEKLSDLKDEVILATVVVSGEILGISFKILELTSEGILCSYPEKIYQINRRSSKRHKIEQKNITSVYLEVFIAKISPSPIILPLTDISIHGLSFKVPVFLKTYFQKGQVLPKAKIVIQGKQFPISCEIRNMLANNEHRYPFRVGVKFIGISGMQQAEIQLFILSQKPAN